MRRFHVGFKNFVLKLGWREKIPHRRYNHQTYLQKKMLYLVLYGYTILHIYSANTGTYTYIRLDRKTGLLHFKTANARKKK